MTENQIKHEKNRPRDGNRGQALISSRITDVKSIWKIVAMTPRKHTKWAKVLETRDVIKAPNHDAILDTLTVDNVSVMIRQLNLIG